MGRARLLVVLALVSVTIAVWPQPRATACTCGLSHDLRSDFEEADAAIEGTVVGVTDEEPTPIPGEPGVVMMPDTVRYTIHVDRALKGTFGETVTVSTSAYGASCGFHAEVGEKTARFLHRHDDGSWGSGLCSGFNPTALSVALGRAPDDDRGTGWPGRLAVALLVGAVLATHRVGQAARR